MMAFWHAHQARRPFQRRFRPRVVELEDRLLLTGVTLVAAGSTWQYLDTGIAPAAAWVSPTFDDSAWSSGPAQLGYGDGDEQTIVSYGPDAAQKHMATFFRHGFTVADAQAFSDLTLQLLRDDGAVVYLNGVEVYRSNLPAGTVAASTPASTSVNGAGETAFLPMSLSPGHLVDGWNVLAVEVHQADAASSDLSFDLGLAGTLMPALPAPIAVIGDYGFSSPSEQAVAALVASWNPGAIVTLGDNNYPTGSASTIDANIGQYFHGFIASYVGGYGPGASENRFFPSLGNHDWDSSTGANPYLSYFTLPGNERYYSVVLGNVEFFIVDSDPREPDGISSTSPQAQWLQAQLAASDAAWQVVVTHHPPFSSSATHGSTAALQWPFQAWGADAVLSGHVHSYERVQRDGLPYIVNGAGGRPLYAFAAPLAGSVVRNNTAFGATRIDASAAQLTIAFYTVGGALVDSLTLYADAPTVDLNGPSSAGIDTAATFLAGGSPAAVLANLTAGSTSGWLTGATVSVLDALDGAAESLSATGTAAIGIAFSGGVLTLSGAASVAEYEQVLRSVRYVNHALNPQTGTARTLAVQVSDGAVSSTTAIAQVNIRLDGDFGAWAGLGGFITQVTGAANADGRLQAFAIGGDNAAWTRTEDTPNGAFGAWTSLGGYVKQLAVGRNADGSLALFAIGGDNAAWLRVQNGPNGDFGPWTSLGGYVKQLVVGRHADGSLALFAIGGDNAAWMRLQDGPNGAFAAWTSLGGYVQQLTVERSAANLALFAIGGDNAAWLRLQNGPNGAFASWTSLGGYVKQLVVGRNADGSLALFAIGGDNAAWLRQQAGPGGAFAAWTSLGGYVKQLAVAANANGSLALFAIGGDDAAWVRTQAGPGGPFAGWHSLGGRTRQLQAMARQDGALLLLVVGGDFGLYGKRQQQPLM